MLDADDCAVGKLRLGDVLRPLGFRNMSPKRPMKQIITVSFLTCPDVGNMIYENNP